MHAVVTANRLLNLCNLLYSRLKWKLHHMFPCLYLCPSSVPASVILNYTLPQYCVRFLMAWTLFGEIIHHLLHMKNEVIMTFLTSVSVIERVWTLPIHVRKRVAYPMQVNGLLPFTNKGKRTRVNRDGQM